MHKPLSSWVSTVDIADTPIVWGHHIPTNDGDERSDARTWSRFEDPAWRRTLVPVVVDGALGTALGLRRGDSDEAVVELDDFSSPILITPHTVDVIDRIEQQWPPATLSRQDIEAVAREGFTLRHALVERLADDGNPDPQIFWLLPWELVDEFCAGLTSLFREIRIPAWISSVQ